MIALMADSKEFKYLFQGWKALGYFDNLDLITGIYKHTWWTHWLILLRLEVALCRWGVINLHSPSHLHFCFFGTSSKNLIEFVYYKKAFSDNCYDKSIWVYDIKTCLIAFVIHRLSSITLQLGLFSHDQSDCSFFLNPMPQALVNKRRRISFLSCLQRIIDC